jgi:hypothetical protein
MASSDDVLTWGLVPPERIAGAYEVIDELTSERGLVTCETIRCLDEAGLLTQARK